MKYENRERYVAAIRELQRRARRSGWDLGIAPKHRLATWLGLSTDALNAHNRAHGIDVEDIRTGSV